ncbi:MAG: hypothetical protein SPE84_04020 [Bullifex sp.]|nr:hypothetical protein [Spirochaetales bacterium]MDY5056507.1 hypothetical protein [Bullifex sp.]
MWFCYYRPALCFDVFTKQIVSFRTFPSKEDCAEHTDQSSVCSSIMRSDLIKVKLFKDLHNSGRPYNVLTATEGTEFR